MVWQVTSRAEFFGTRKTTVGWWSREARGRPLVGLIALLLACQDYPFETRPTERVQAKRINEVVGVVRPTDILFMVDNSGSMSEEMAELRANIRLFVDALVQSPTDFQVGVITPDVECNVPERDCTTVSSHACCRRNQPMCTESDNTGDGKIDTSNCDGGRLRADPQTGKRIFGRPELGDEDTWVEEVSRAIVGLGCQGSGYEATFEAVRRAVLCGAEHADCEWQAVQDLNAGFIRPEADLVIIFLTDEDDCSFRDASVYHRLENPGDPVQQQQQLCSPEECYAFYGSHLNSSGNHLPDWSDTNPHPQYFQCGENQNIARLVPPPDPEPIEVFLNDYIKAKGGDVSRVRAAAITGAVGDISAPLGFRSAACYATPAGPHDGCGCWSVLGDVGRAGQLHCALTESLGQLAIPFPNRDPVPACGLGDGDMLVNDGCLAMPSSRIMALLQELSDRRVQAGAPSDTLVDSICRAKYDTTMLNIVFNVILSNCVEMGVAPSSPDDIQVRFNGDLLPRVEPGSEMDGWSWTAGANQICLEGSLSKNLGDQFEVFVVDGN